MWRLTSISSLVSWAWLSLVAEAAIEMATSAATGVAVSPVVVTPGSTGLASGVFAVGDITSGSARRELPTDWLLCDEVGNADGLQAGLLRIRF